MSKERRVHGGTEKYTEIITADKMDRKCHAYHEYVIVPHPDNPASETSFASITFQKGPVKEAGVNGCSLEDLLVIVKDVLTCLQAGRFPCPENEKALKGVNDALDALWVRTRDREQRGVEGQHKE